MSATDPLFAEYHDLTDVPPHFLHEVAHFFEVYKDLEGMRTKPLGWEDADAAKEEIAVDQDVRRSLRAARAVSWTAAPSLG